MRRLLVLSLEVFLMMCLPAPQAAYAAVGLGHAAGLDTLAMFGLYVVSDIVAFLVVVSIGRRYGLPGLERLAARLPRWMGARLLRMTEQHRPSLALPAMFLTGYLNLYLAAVTVGLSRMRIVPASAFGILGDVIQFTSTVLLAGLLARLLPLPGAEWIVLFTLPALLAVLPVAARWLSLRLARTARPRGVRRAQPHGPPLPVSVLADDAHD